MANTTKKPTKNDFEQAIEYAFNENTRTLGTSSFVVSKVNHEINFDSRCRIFVGQLFRERKGAD